MFYNSLQYSGTKTVGERNCIICTNHALAQSIPPGPPRRHRATLPSSPARTPTTGLFPEGDRLEAHDEVRPTAMRLPPRSFPASRPLLRMDLQSPGQDGQREAQLASRPALSGRHQTAPQTQGHAGQDGAPLANRFSSPGEASREYRLTSGCAAWSHYRLFSALRLPTVAYPACSPSLAPHRPPSGSRSDEKSGLGANALASRPFSTRTFDTRPHRNCRGFRVWAKAYPLRIPLEALRLQQPGTDSAVGRSTPMLEKRHPGPGRVCFKRLSGGALPASLHSRLNTGLHVAQSRRFFQRLHRIARGHEFMRKISRETGIHDGFRHRPPLQLLRAVQLMPAGYAAGVEVSDVLDVLPDGADDRAFHDLHVINVIQQLHARRIHALDEFHAPDRVVALIVVVVDLAVEQFHADGDAFVFGELLHAVQADDAVVEALRVRLAAPVARERNYVGYLGGRGPRDVFLHLAHQSIMVFLAVKAIADGAGAGRHGRNQPVLLHGGPLLVVDQIDTLEADARPFASQVVEADLAVAPARRGLLQAALQRGRLGAQGGQGSRRARQLEYGSSCHSC